jgi:hypothetical protein
MQVMRKFPMSDFIPKPGAIKIGGLGPKAQKLQALREKAAQAAQGKSGAKAAASSSSSVKVKDSFANTKKTTFQRKAV